MNRAKPEAKNKKKTTELKMNFSFKKQTDPKMLCGSVEDFLWYIPMLVSL